jgi:hypothetical protein
MAENSKRPAYQSDPFLGAVAISYGGGDQTFDYPIRGVYVGTTGHLKVDMASGETVTFSNLPVGFAWIAIRKVYQTGSTAAGLALY